MNIISGNSNPQLALEVASELGEKIVNVTVTKFSDQEVFVEILENVRGKNVFVIQSTSAPANDHLMELLITIDALKRASAQTITAVIPYFGYARQDRKVGPRTPISAKLVANILTTAGIDRLLTIDLHAGQIQGFFDIPVDNLYAAPIIFITSEVLTLSLLLSTIAKFALILLAIFLALTTPPTSGETTTISSLLYLV